MDTDEVFRIENAVLVLFVASRVSGRYMLKDVICRMLQ